MRKLRELKRSLYNLYYYFRVIWNDRDWDHAYMWQLQLKKFEKAYKYRTTSRYCMRSIGQEKVEQALRICIIILGRLNSDWYINLSNYDINDNHLVLQDRDWIIYNKLIIKYQRQFWD